MSSKQERLARVKQQIREACQKSGRDESEVRLLAVSKTKGWEEVRDFLELGQEEFGENYMQEAMAKAQALQQWIHSQPGVKRTQWHFIGNLQSNKAKFLPGNFTLFHALDSLSLASKLNKEAAAKSLFQDCLLEVNLDGEDSKGGVSPEEAAGFLEKMTSFPHIRILGLMCIPAPQSGIDPRRPFARLRELKDSLNAAGAYSAPLRELSMGMSSDFAEAILEGSTFVRIGTSLFGERGQ